MFQSLKNKLKQIQESDERTKKKWLIIMSILSMIIVSALWIVLFNNLIGRIEMTDSGKSENTGFWQVFNSGLKSIGGSGWDEIKNLYSRIVGGMFIKVEK